MASTARQQGRSPQPALDATTVCHACKDVLLELVWLAESVTDLNVLAARVFWVHTGI